MSNLIASGNRYHTPLAILAIFVGVTCGVNVTVAQFKGDDSAPQFVTKVYNIADLLDSPLMLDDESKQDSRRKPTQGGGANPGGGGMFRIPDNVLPQFGGGGGGFGGGMGGMGGGGMGGTMSVDSLPDSMTREALETLLLDHLSDDQTSWYSIDAVGGKLSIVASMLVVTHTDQVQARVARLLDALRLGNRTSPTVQVDVRIIEVASDQSLTKLMESDNGIDRLAEDVSAARLSLRCDNHRIAKVSSGLRRSYVVSLVPVVGGNVGVGNSAGAEAAVNNFAYQPVTYSPLLGLFGKIKPDISDDQKSGRIHLGIELASGPEEVVSATFGTGQSIDRLELETARLETSINTPALTWTLAGSVAVTDPTSNLTSGEALPHLAILVRWKSLD